MKTLVPRPGVVAGYLAGLEPFRALPAPSLEALAAGASLRLLERGELLFRQDEPAAALHCLVRVSVRVLRSLPDGREKVIHLQQAPCLLAEAPVFMGTTFPSTAECNEECLVLVLPRTHLLAAARQDPELPWRLVAQLFQRLRQLTGSLATHARRSAAARVATYLLDLAAAAGQDTLELPAAKKDVASYLGLRPESFSRALALLQQQGAIAVSEGQVRLIDREALEQAGEEGE